MIDVDSRKRKTLIVGQFGGGSLNNKRLLVAGHSDF